jgi:hypothetical protein
VPGSWPWEACSSVYSTTRSLSVSDAPTLNLCDVGRRVCAYIHTLMVKVYVHLMVKVYVHLMVKVYVHLMVKVNLMVKVYVCLNLNKQTCFAGSLIMWVETL